MRRAVPLQPGRRAPASPRFLPRDSLCKQAQRPSMRGCKGLVGQVLCLPGCSIVCRNQGACRESAFRCDGINRAANSVCSPPRCGGGGWGGGLWRDARAPTQTPIPGPSTAEFGLSRVWPSKMPNGGKPKFGWGGQQINALHQARRDARA
jgi:hypothetical protein